MRHAKAKKTPAAGDPAPSARYLQLGRMSSRDLETVFLRGRHPDASSLAGWEFRGLNTAAWAPISPIRKFMKGFYRRDGELYGYNIPIRQNRLHEPWLAKPDHERPKRFGFYKVVDVDPTSRDNFYLHSVLLDYGRGGNRRFDPARNIRDYLVQVDEENPDLYLGKAYYGLGPARIPVGFFLLERLRKGIGEVRSY